MISLKPDFKPDAGVSLPLELTGDWIFVKSLFMLRDHMETWMSTLKNREGYKDVIAPAEVLAAGPDAAEFLAGQKILINSEMVLSGKWASSGTLLARKSAVVARFGK